MCKDFSKMSLDILEAFFYNPTEEERKEIAKILSSYNERDIKVYEERIAELSGKGLSDFGKFLLEKAQRGIKKCLEKRKEYNEILK